MLRDLSAASNIENVSLDEYVVLPGQEETVYTVPVATNETVQVVFDYTIHDRRSKNSRVGNLQVMANGHEGIPNPVPAAHVMTEAYGPEPDLYGIQVESGGTSLQFKVVNNTTQEEPIYVSANIRIVHIPEWPAPRLRLTITGMSGGQNINGLSNGIHTLEPLLYHRTPYGGGGPSTTIYGSTLSFSTGTQRERWTWKAPSPAGLGTSWFGILQMEAVGGASSQFAFRWNDGGTATTSVIAYSTGVTGFFKDRALANSVTFGAVTLAWEREPVDRPTAWGNY